MKEKTIQDILSNELYTPNRKITIKGEHFFADRALFTNMYGISFFPNCGDMMTNPYTAPIYKSKPSVLDDIIGDSSLVTSTKQGTGEIYESIMWGIDKKYTQRQDAPEKNLKRLGCSCEAEAYIENNSVYFLYGSVIPNAVCITDNTISMQMPFCPLKSISLFDGERTLQTVNLPVFNTSLGAIASVAIDYSVATKGVSIKLDEELCGSVEFQYSIDIGTTKCESGKVKIITKMA